jgi:hypothetical protein
MFWSWLQTTRKTDKVRKHSPRSPYRPRLEGLEDRTLLSVNFVVDPSVSRLTLSGDLGGTPIQQQGAGSLVTSYTGTINASYDQANGLITFNAAGTNVVANNSGTWQPAVGGGSGSAPANYGGQITIAFVTARAAVRNFAANVTSSALNVDGSGNFPVNSLTLTTTAGTADYNAGIIGSGTASIAGQSATNAATTSGSVVNTPGGGPGDFDLSVPIDITITQVVQGMTAHLRAMGTVTAHAQTPVISLNGYSAFLDTTSGATSTPMTDGNASISSNGAQMLNSLVITLGSIPDDPAEFLAADTSQTPNLTANYDSSTGVGILTISGTGTLSDYTTVLNTVTYNNVTGGTSNPGDRGNVTFVAMDTAGNMSQVGNVDLQVA